MASTMTRSRTQVLRGFLPGQTFQHPNETVVKVRAVPSVRSEVNKDILLEGLPRGIELKQVTGAMGEVEGVLDIHDLHIWSLGSETHACSCHVLIEDMPPSASESILKCIQARLGRFGIHHATIQFEHVPCVISGEGCRMTAAERHAHDHPHHH